MEQLEISKFLFYENGSLNMKNAGIHKKTLKIVSLVEQRYTHTSEGDGIYHIAPY